MAYSEVLLLLFGDEVAVLRGCQSLLSSSLSAQIEAQRPRNGKRSQLLPALLCPHLHNTREVPWTTRSDGDQEQLVPATLVSKWSKVKVMAHRPNAASAHRFTSLLSTRSTGEGRTNPNTTSFTQLPESPSVTGCLAFPWQHRSSSFIK